MAPVLEVLIQLNGTDSEPVTDVAIEGLQFTHTETVFMKEYEYPLGSDWGLRRSAAVVLENARKSSVDSCLFDRVGGNAVLLSRNTRDCHVTRNEIALPGESGVLLIGRADSGVRANATTDNNTISLNNIHGVGVFGKQTSCVAQTVTSRTAIEYNLCFEGPRAGFNFLDGTGGNRLTGNLGFAMVRETGDHGFVNSWDREPYETIYRDGTPSLIAADTLISRNLILGGWGGQHTLDHDDGSTRYQDTYNFLTKGGCKSNWGAHKNCSQNVVLGGDLGEGGSPCKLNTHQCLLRFTLVYNSNATIDEIPAIFLAPLARETAGFDMN